MPHTSHKRIGIIAIPLLFLSISSQEVFGQLKINGTLRVERDRMVRLKAEGAPEGAALFWDISPEETTDIEEINGRVLFTGPPGKYKVKLRYVKLDKEGKTVGETARCVVEIGGIPDPLPPDPGPGPTPTPTPTPTPPAPIPLIGLRVLMVYETSELPKYTKEQSTVFFSKSVRDYLNSNCPIGPDGKTREWRIYDKDVDVSGESKTWQDAMKRDRKSTPWVIISNGKTGYEGPLPENVDKTLELLKKYQSVTHSSAGSTKRIQKKGR